MKRILQMLLVATITFGCNNDDGLEYSAIADFIGEWELEGKTLNNGIPVEISEETLSFTEDNNFEDLTGRYNLMGETESSGFFFISGLPYDLTFENTTGDRRTTSFNIVEDILTLEYQDDNGDTVREVWRKKFYYESE